MSYSQKKYEKNSKNCLYEKRFNYKTDDDFQFKIWDNNFKANNRIVFKYASCISNCNLKFRVWLSKLCFT